MIANPFTGQVLNANPEGHNQYHNPDGPSTPKPQRARVRKITDSEWIDMDEDARSNYLLRAVRALPEGARPRTALQEELHNLIGSAYASGVSQRDMARLAVCHPDDVDCSFTLGLDEVILKKKKRK